jgi:hypothetical protein
MSADSNWLRPSTEFAITALEPCMSVLELDLFLSGLPERPKAVRVTQGLWDALLAAGLLTMTATPSSELLGAGFKLPSYKNIILVLDPELSKTHHRSFALPHSDDSESLHEPNAVRVKIGSAQNPVNLQSDAIRKMQQQRDRRWLGRA